MPFDGRLSRISKTGCRSCLATLSPACSRRFSEALEELLNRGLTGDRRRPDSTQFRTAPSASRDLTFQSDHRRAGETRHISGVHRKRTQRSALPCAGCSSKLLRADPHAEFAPRTMWSLSNAFASALKSLDPIPFFQATAKLGTFLNTNN